MGLRRKKPEQPVDEQIVGLVHTLVDAASSKMGFFKQVTVPAKLKALLDMAERQKLSLPKFTERGIPLPIGVEDVKRPGKRTKEGTRIVFPGDLDLTIDWGVGKVSGSLVGRMGELKAAKSRKKRVLRRAVEKVSAKMKELCPEEFHESIDQRLGELGSSVESQIESKGIFDLDSLKKLNVATLLGKGFFKEDTMRSVCEGAGQKISQVADVLAKEFPLIGKQHLSDMVGQLVFSRIGSLKGLKQLLEYDHEQHSDLESLLRNALREVMKEEVFEKLGNRLALGIFGKEKQALSEEELGTILFDPAVLFKIWSLGDSSDFFADTEEMLKKRSTDRRNDLPVFLALQDRYAKDLQNFDGGASVPEAVLQSILHLEPVMNGGKKLDHTNYRSAARQNPLISLSPLTRARVLGNYLSKTDFSQEFQPRRIKSLKRKVVERI